MRIWPFGILGGLAATMVYFASGQASALRPLSIESAPVRFAVNDPEETRAGTLEWRGTIRLTSSDGDFGGLSGLAVSKDGRRFLAITDQAHWVTGTLDYDAAGRLSSAKGDAISPMLDLKGKPMSGKQGDAEGLAPLLQNDVDGPVAVSFEGDHRIWIYDTVKNGQRKVLRAVDPPEGFAEQPGNGGIEGLAMIGKARLAAFSEDGRDGDGHIKGWVLSSDPIKTKDRTGVSADLLKGQRQIAVKTKDPFAITDAHVLDGKTILVLERRFSRQTGVGFQMRALPIDELNGNVAADGPVLAHLGMSFVIDNMEGVSVRSSPSGETLIYIVSDDNFNRPLQQTLLMMFAVRK